VIRIVAVIALIWICSFLDNTDIPAVNHEYDMAIVERQYETLHEELLIEKHRVVALKDTLIFIEEQHRRKVEALKTKYEQEHQARVMVTFYHPATGGINTDGNPDMTATMTKPRSGITIAISTSLVEKGWLSRRIYIDGYGMFIAEDRMSTELKGNRIDICAPTLAYALKKGRIRNVLACPVN